MQMLAWPDPREQHPRLRSTRDRENGAKIYVSQEGGCLGLHVTFTHPGFLFTLDSLAAVRQPLIKDEYMDGGLQGPAGCLHA